MMKAQIEKITPQGLIKLGKYRVIFGDWFFLLPSKSKAESFARELEENLQINKLEKRK